MAKLDKMSCNSNFWIFALPIHVQYTVHTKLAVYLNFLMATP